MFKTYRRPTVVVIGGGVAGCTSAAECGVAGYATTLVETYSRLGGQYARPGAPSPGTRTALHTPYLRGQGTDGTAESLCRQLSNAVTAPDAPCDGVPGVSVLTGTTAVDAVFDRETGRWAVTLRPADGEAGDDSAPAQVIHADILIRATGNSTPPLRWSNRSGGEPSATAQPTDSLHLHQGVQPVGAPNLLILDAPEPPGAARARRPLDIVEARADHCRRYVRQLEIRGPGTMTVDSASWSAQKSTRRAAVNDLHTIHVGALRFSPATGSETSRRHDSQKKAS
ncbi:FAD-dependent oxidoreductase [Corynebacterium terpenotabidum]|uniref:Oxidoreductase n=1 Tax=Corynebacterium terpenotabidum Y-11 TaxID=1200352 RepID=S4XI13_9CORY|nr:FAD-dependent oxidoreductase [Corynebacterium terpenotabidum]AGP31330.1 hypothetical protein A606_08435 [Corynebacterium terpenotabidum Y-11]